MEAITEERQLRDLLSDEAKRERKAYKRGTLFVAVAVAVGVGWLAYSAYKVTTFQHQSSVLNNQIQGQKQELASLQNKLSLTNNDLAEATQRLTEAKEAVDKAQEGLENAKKDFQSIAAGKTNPRAEAKRAIQRVNNSSKQVNDASQRVGSTDTWWAGVWSKVKDGFSSKTEYAQLGANDSFGNVPDVRNYTLAEAQKALERAGFSYEVHAGDQKLKVVGQNPSPGTRVLFGAKVQLSFAASP